MAFDFGSAVGITYSSSSPITGYGQYVNAGYAHVTGVITDIDSFTVDIAIRKTTGSGNTFVAIGLENLFWLGITAAAANVSVNYGVGGSAVTLDSGVYGGDGTWRRVRFSMSPTGAVLLIDGVVVASSVTPASGAGSTSAALSNPLQLGRFLTTFNWAADIDEVAVWDGPKPGAYTPALISDTASGLAAVWHLDGNLSDTRSAPSPTTATLTGPTSGTTGAASTNFTVTLDIAAASTVTITPAGTVGSVTFSPSAPTIGVGQTSVTFTATPASDGAHDISITTSPTLTYSGSPITYTTSSAAATAVTLSGPTSGTVGAASSNFTVGANGVISGSVVVTPSDGGGGGSFTPSSVTISAGTPTATFAYTAGSTGAKTISVTNSGGLSNPSNITYTASAAALYTQVNATDALTGNAIMILVPAAGSANPYNSAVPTGVIMYCHGAGEDQTALLSDSLKATCVTALLNAGYILAGSNAAGNNWGNQAGVDAYAGLDKYLRDNYNVAGVALWSQSAGGPSGLSAIIQAKVRGIVGWLGTYPVCNLANMMGGAYAGSINTAYGVTGSGTSTYANKTYGSDPLLHVANDFRDVPMRFYASNSDTVVPGAQHSTLMQALVAASRREAVLVACTGDHGDPSHFVPSEYVDFFDRCFAAPVAPSSRTITTTLGSAVSLTGLKWAFWNEATPNLMQAPASSGAAETTDGSGVLSISVSTTLAPGGIGWLVVTSSNGTTNDATGRVWSGPVAVA